VLLDDADIDAFFKTADFGTVAEYTKGAATRSIVVIFDREYTPTTLGDADVQMTVPKALCKSKDVEGIDQSATLLIAGVTYKVAEHHPDARGFTEVILTRD
jgi:hypothetical protein